MRVLLLAPRVPFPADNGGKLRVAHVALRLAEEYEVAMACFAEDGEVYPDADTSARFLEFRVVPLSASTRRLRDRLGRDPSGVRRFRSVEMERCVREMVGRFCPDVLLASDPLLTPYVVPYSDKVRILDYVCVDTLQIERLQALAPGYSRVLWVLRRLKIAAYLRRIAREYDLCLVNSAEDRVALLAAAPAWGRVEVLPNGVEVTAYPLGLAVPRPDVLVYPGALTYGPNLDAAWYFVREILPRIRRAVPEARLLITGRIPTDGSAPQGPGISYTGWVPDVRPLIAGAWAMPVPLRSGAGGARFKVLEALALGTPVVATAIGAEGVAVRDGVDILMAETPEAFAAQSLRILRSPDLRARLAEAGRRLIEQRYDWLVLGARLSTMVGDLTAAKRRLTGGRVRERGDGGGPGAPA